MSGGPDEPRDAAPREAPGERGDETTVGAGDEGRGRARSRAVRMTLVLAPVLGFALLLASGLGKDPTALPSELVARPAPTFSLQRLGGGGTVDLQALRGQVVVVNFWASWCAACRLEHPALLAAWERYRERGVVLVGVDFEDTERDALAYQAEMGGDWPIVADPGSRTAIAYGVFGVPETFVVAPDGTIVAKQVGAVSYDWLTDEIESALRTGEAAR